MSYNYNKVYNYNITLNKISNYFRETASLICISVAYTTKSNDDDFYKADLPVPTAIIQFSEHYVLIYQIIEQAKSNNAKKMFSDIKKRFVITLKNKTNATQVKLITPFLIARNLDYKQNYIISNNTYGMRYLSGCLDSISPFDLTLKEQIKAFEYSTNKKISIKELKQIQSKTQKEFAEIKYNNVYDKIAKLSNNQTEIKLLEKLTDDEIFDTLRELAYRFYASNSYINEEILYQLGLSAGVPEKTSKGRVLEYKTKAIVEWINKKFNKKDNINNWNYKRKTKTNKDYEMTRKDNITKINKLRAIDRQKKVEQAVESLKFLNERISVRKVAEYAKISTKTAQKYLKELREKGVI